MNHRSEYGHDYNRDELTTHNKYEYEHDYDYDQERNMIATPSRVEDRLRKLADEAVASPGFADAPGHPAWDKLRSVGTDLWLDTGNLEEARSLWTREFTSLTTNNTLANQ